MRVCVRLARLGTLGVVLATAAATPLQAYTTQPLAPVHEMMTRVAEECRLAAQGRPPVDCRASYDRMRRLTGWRRFFTRARFTPLERGARWPDDPRREMLVSWSYQVLHACEAKGVDRPLPEAGLLCSSHYGRLQFMHAMASRKPPPAREDAAETRSRMLAWAALTYRVAKEGAAAETLCAYFARHPSGIAADLAPPGSIYCPGGGVPSEWTLGRLFTITCRGADTCSPPVGPEASELARETAKGALLHLIQDSYSQSHAARGEVRPREGPFAPHVECLPAAGYYEYSAQSSSAHRAADKRPLLGESCLGDWAGSEARVVDAITASAVALWHIDNKASTWEDLERYLATRVFPSGTGQASPATAPA